MGPVTTEKMPAGKRCLLCPTREPRAPKKYLAVAPALTELVPVRFPAETLDGESSPYAEDAGGPEGRDPQPGSDLISKDSASRIPGPSSTVSASTA